MIINGSILLLFCQGSLVTDSSKFFLEIPNQKPVRLFLPVISNDDRLLIQCVFKKLDGKYFNLLFKSGTLPVDRIDIKPPCLINLDLGGQSVSLESNIVEVSDGQTLKMIAQKTINHDQMREYFRVDCTVPIILKSIIPEEFSNPEDDNWKISGTTVDLSGSGLRASFTTAPPAKTQVRLELALPTTETTIIKTIASPVRISQLTEKLWDAAYQFDEIEDEDQDAIIGCCLVAQRRLLRLKVKVKGS